MLSSSIPLSLNLGSHLALLWALAQVNLAGGGQVPGTGLQTSPFSAQTSNTQKQQLQQLETNMLAPDSSASSKRAIETQSKN